MPKSALHMFIKCLALELGPKGIPVNAIKYLSIKMYKICIHFCIILFALFGYYFEVQKQ